MTTQPKQKINSARIVLWSLIAFICFCSFMFYTSVKNTPPPPAPPTSTPSQTPPPTETSTPTATVNQPAQKPTITLTPTVTRTPRSTATTDPDAVIKREIRSILGSSNRDIPRVTSLTFGKPQGAIIIRWSLNDYLTTDLIGYSARYESTKILEAIHDSGVNYNYVTLSASFLMIDNFGSTSEKDVFTLTFYKSTVEKINWELFDVTKLDNIADSADIWVELRDN